MPIESIREKKTEAIPGWQRLRIKPEAVPTAYSGPFPFARLSFVSFVCLNFKTPLLFFIFFFLLLLLLLLLLLHEQR